MPVRVNPGHRSGEADQKGLGPGVRDVATRRNEPADGRNVDDRAMSSREHVRQNGSAQPHGRLDVYLDHGPLPLGGDCHKRASRYEPSGVDQEADVRQRLDARTQTVNLPGVRQVGLEDLGSRARSSFHLGRERLQPVCTTSNQDQAISIGSKPPSKRGPDTAGRAGDNGSGHGSAGVSRNRCACGACRSSSG